MASPSTAMSRDEELVAIREVLRRMREHSEDSFIAALIPIIAEALESADVLKVVACAKAAIIAGNSEDAIALLKGIERWHQELKQRAELEKIPSVSREVH